MHAQPEIHCVDYWPDGIPPHALSAYKTMIDAGQITRRTVTVNRARGSVMVDYLSTIPHEWIRQEMARLSKGEMKR
jgi:hypothetical protein